MAYYSIHGISQFLFNNEKQRVRFLLARPVYIAVSTEYRRVTDGQRHKDGHLAKALSVCLSVITASRGYDFYHVMRMHSAD